MPEDVKLLPGQLLGIQQTVRESRPPPLPHRPPLPSFESPPLESASSESRSLEPESLESTYAHIDEFDSDPGEEAAASRMQPAQAEATANVDSGR